MTSDSERVSPRPIVCEPGDDSSTQQSSVLTHGNLGLTDDCYQEPKSVEFFLEQSKDSVVSDKEEKTDQSVVQMDPAVDQNNESMNNFVTVKAVVDLEPETRPSRENLDANENGNETLCSQSMAAYFSKGKKLAQENGFLGHDEDSSRSELPNAEYNCPNGRASLEESSLDAIVAFIKTKDFARSGLDEDEIVAFTHATHRHAENRTKYRKNLAMMGSYPQNAYDRIYQEEEFFSLADAFFRDIVDGASEMAGFDLSNKALTWLKRAAGLQKPNDPLEKSIGFYSYSEEEQRRDGRRRTRRAKKEKGKDFLETDLEGLSIFEHAIYEIEEQAEEKPVSRIPLHHLQSEVSEGSFTLGEDMSDSHDDVRSMRTSAYTQEVREYPPGSKLLAELRSGSSSGISIRVICGGKVVSEADKNGLSKWRARRKRQSQRKDEVMKKRPRSSSDDVGFLQTSIPKEVCVGDRIRAWCTQDMRYHPARVVERNGKKVFLCYDGGESGWVDLAMNQYQIVEPGDVDYNEKVYKPCSSKGPLEYGLPDLSDSIYAFPFPGTPKTEQTLKPFSQSEFFTKLYHLLGGQARKWARYEFFYPDFDAAWYQFDANATGIASMVPPNVRLTWTEWRVVRRQLGPPRRFAKSFVVDELYKRNEYRRMVRLLQRNPGSTKGQGFPVPPLIDPGTAVTAYNKRYQIIHRGIVLFYSPGDNGYFVQFDSVDLGCEFCPDTDVARVEPPKPVLIKSEAKSKGSTASSLDEFKHLDENDLCFERYSLVSMISTIERLLQRKRGILDAMEENNRSDLPQVAGQCRRPSSKCDPRPSEELQFSVSSWLHANLILTNNSLREANRLFQAAYSQGSQVGVDSPRSDVPPVGDEEGVIIDLSRRKFLTEQIIQSVGFHGQSLQLQECTEALLEMEMHNSYGIPLPWN